MIVHLLAAADWPRSIPQVGKSAFHDELFPIRKEDELPMISRLLLSSRMYLSGAARCSWLLTTGVLSKQGRRQLMGISGAGMLPVVDLSELVPTGFQLEFIEPAAVDGNVGLLEMAAISALTRNQKPRAVFEIGTFDGRTTVNLAANVSQETNIYTLNLPPKDVENTGLEIGEWDHKYVSMTQRRPGFEDRRITQLWGDSATFDFSPFRSAIDVVFIDGAHSYDYVMNDSMKALELLRDGVGTILWHDYGTPFCPGVTKALDSLQRKNKRFRNLKHIEGTNLACVLIR